MGRHRAGPTAARTTDAGTQVVDSRKRRTRTAGGGPAAPRYELLGWGVFMAVVSAAAMLIFAMPAQVVFLVPAVCLAAFVLLWMFMRLH